MKTPIITVIIPIYNAERYLTKCIESVTNQSYKNLEIILVNDGSLDKSLEICEEFSDRDERIVIINKSNGGVSSARNAGLDVACGQFVGFVDSDDYIEVDMFEKLYLSSLEHNADIVECGYMKKDMNYQIIRKVELIEDVTVSEYECSYEYLSYINTTDFNCNKLYKRDLFKEVRFSNLAFSEDYELNAKVFYKCRRKATIKGCYYNYIDNNFSARNQEFSIKKFDAIEAGKKVFDFHQNRFTNLCPLVAQYICNNIMQLTYLLYFSEIKDKEIYLIKFKNDFDKYYEYIKQHSDKKTNLSKKVILHRIFKFNPKFYFIIRKILKR